MLSRTFILMLVLHICLVTADFYVRDGIAYLDGWGETATYYAVDFEPVCGVLKTGQTSPIDQVSCKTEMAHYKVSNKTFATYNNLGVETNNMPGDGEEFCLCFSLKDTDGKMGDFCMLVTSDGQTSNWWTMANDRRANGQFMPASDKALPQCPDVNVTSISATHIRTKPTPPPISTGYYSGQNVYISVTVTLTPTIATFPTGTRTITSTLAGGSVITVTQTLFSTAPVIQTGYSYLNAGRALGRSDDITVKVWICMFLQVAIVAFL